MRGSELGSGSPWYTNNKWAVNFWPILNQFWANRKLESKVWRWDQSEGKWKSRWNMLVTTFLYPLFPLATLSFLPFTQNLWVLQIFSLALPSPSCSADVRGAWYLKKSSPRNLWFHLSQEREAVLVWTHDLSGGTGILLGACPLVHALYALGCHSVPSYVNNHCSMWSTMRGLCV